MGLEYIGNGAFLPHIPARDLDKDEIKQHGGITRLVKTGLYRKPKPGEDKAVAPSEDKGQGG